MVTTPGGQPLIARRVAGRSAPERLRQAGITAPAQIADFIDQLRADGVVLTYDPRDRTLCADGHGALSVTVGKNR